MNTEQMKPRLTGNRLIGTPGCRAEAECDGTGCIPVIAGGGGLGKTGFGSVRKKSQVLQ